MKIFSKEKYFEVEGRESYDWLVEAGIPEKKCWQTKCDGKAKEECEKEGWRIRDEWCVEKGEEKMYTMKDFIEKKIAVRTGTGEKQRKFLEMCEKAGLMWKNKRATGVRPDFYGEKCCITYGFGHDKTLEFCKAKFYEDAGWQIVEYKDIAETANSERYEIKISVDGDLTTAEMIVDGKAVKTATAKRNPADKFNFRKGAELAFTRLFAKKNEEKDDNRSLRLGDRVVCKTNGNGNLETAGKHGKIIALFDGSTILSALVEFDHDIHGHNGDGKGKKRRCWWCKFETLVREKAGEEK